MRRQCQQRLGFSLIEMVIVLAVIGLMAALAIPSMARLGLFYDNATREASRVVFTFMKAAQVYSETYRVDTAVAYSVNSRTDSVTGATVLVIDGMTMVRRLRDEEFAAILASLPPGNPANASFKQEIEGGSKVNPFIPVTDDNGQFQAFKKSVTIPDPNFIPVQVNGPGYTPIRIYDPRFLSSPSGLLILPRQQAFSYQFDTTDPNNVSNPLDFRFPAHIFRPNGTLRGSVGRMIVFVTPAPDALPTERFTDAARTLPVAPYVIELYPTMGRLQISFGEPT